MRQLWVRLLAMGLLLGARAPSHAAFDVSPSFFLLDSPEACQQLLVTGRKPDGQAFDLTRTAAYQVGEPRLVSVDSNGLVRARAEGKTEILVRHGRDSARVRVEVFGLIHPVPPSFECQIIPILTKARCNSGGCHGKAEGQNGFKLSVFGFDPMADYGALAHEARGRRVLLSAPERSLLLRKATADVPHGGGRRIQRDGDPYRRLRRWIGQGAGFGEDKGGIAAIVVEPKEHFLHAGASQQLQVTAIDRTGKRRCVTTEAEYESNASVIADVNARGLVQAANVPGEAAVLVRFMGQVGVCRITVPRPNVQFVRPAEESFIDRLVWDKLQRLGIPPSDPAGDAVFLRRVFLDTIGTLPTPAEARRFLASSAPDKRRRLIDQLLERDAYADYWTMRWSDVLRVDRDKLTAQGAVAMTRWLRRQLAENRPYDQMVRDILTVRGDSRAEGPAAFYLVFDTPEVAARSMSQLFLGVRIQCAECHHHPFEKWGQDDYYGLAGFFTGVARKGLPTGGTAILARSGADLKHPKSGRPVRARPLGGPATDFTGVTDRRQPLADWLTASDNPFLARAIANRLWAHYFGRGLVEPIDDIRATNPATNEPLLTALAGHLRDRKFDLKAFTKTLLSSRAYQLSARTVPDNATDDQNFSHAAYRPLPAEVLLDALCQATAVPEKFSGWPEGYRAIQVWDNRMPSYFFRVFGRPVRTSVCECERSTEPSISQALHLMNSPEILSKIRSPRGRARQLADSKKPPKEIVEELCLATLSRYPSGEEAALLAEAFTRSDRRTATEDVLWALLNAKEFIYNH